MAYIFLSVILKKWLQQTWSLPSCSIYSKGVGARDDKKIKRIMINKDCGKKEEEYIIEDESDLGVWEVIAATLNWLGKLNL